MLYWHIPCSLLAVRPSNVIYRTFNHGSGISKSLFIPPECTTYKNSSGRVTVRVRVHPGLPMTLGIVWRSAHHSCSHSGKIKICKLANLHCWASQSIFGCFHSIQRPWCDNWIFDSDFYPINITSIVQRNNCSDVVLFLHHNNENMCTTIVSMIPKRSICRYALEFFNEQQSDRQHILVTSLFSSGELKDENITIEYIGKVCKSRKVLKLIS